MVHGWEIENFLEVKDQRLHIDGVDGIGLAREFGTPLFVFSEKRIRSNIERLKKSAEAITCPLKLCYAAKAMSTLGILRAIKNADCDLEVNSGGELQKALKAGFSGDQIIFNGTSKENWEIELAIKNSIYAIQADSVYELSLIDDAAKRLGMRANVSLRLVPEIESHTHSGLQTALLTSKFGMMPQEAFQMVSKFRSSETVKISGLHLHIGSQNPEISPYIQAFTILFDTLLKIFRETGHALEHLNLGGGFPINYLRDRSQAEDFHQQQAELFTAEFEPSDAIRQAWQSVLERAEKEDVRHLLDSITLLVEPGRSIISDTGICLTTVRNAKTRPIESVSNDPTRIDETDRWLLTDAGFNILLSMETYKWYYHLISAERADEAHDALYKLAGPLCDGGDVYFDIEGKGRLPEHRRLPSGVEPGEILALLNCGAYSLAQASQYNGRYLPAVVLIKNDGNVELIRRRDSFEDLIANDF